MMIQFNIGDVVMLVSGGPRMTVFKQEGDVVLVDWFDNDAQRRQGEFSIRTVKKVRSALDDAGQ